MIAPYSPPEETRVISTNIRELLRERSMPQASAAVAIGMPQRTWNRKMSNPQTWTIGELDRLAAELRVPRSAITG